MNLYELRIDRIGRLKERIQLCFLVGRKVLDMGSQSGKAIAGIEELGLRSNETPLWKDAGIRGVLEAGDGLLDGVELCIC